MARKIINEPFMLIESDLIFEPSLLTEMLYPDRIAIARMKPWLNGSTVTLNQSNEVDAFHSDAINGSNEIRYKTVNIYSFSVSSWYQVIGKLNQYILAGRVNDYYEAVFQQMVVEKSLSLQAVHFDNQPWYEVDTIEDLASAEKLFPIKTGKPLPLYALKSSELKKKTIPVRKSVLKDNFYA